MHQMEDCSRLYIMKMVSGFKFSGRSFFFFSSLQTSRLICCSWNTTRIRKSFLPEPFVSVIPNTPDSLSVVRSLVHSRWTSLCGHKRPWRAQVSSLGGWPCFGLRLLVHECQLEACMSIISSPRSDTDTSSALKRSFMNFNGHFWSWPTGWTKNLKKYWHALPACEWCPNKTDAYEHESLLFSKSEERAQLFNGHWEGEDGRWSQNSWRTEIVSAAVWARQFIR